MSVGAENHQIVPTTPHEAYTSHKPDLPHLKIFGSYVTSKRQRGRATKLAHNVSHGILLGYTTTDRNIIFRNDVSDQVKFACHVIFDECHYHWSKRPPYAEYVYNIGDMSNKNKNSTPDKSAPGQDINEKGHTIPNNTIEASTPTDTWEIIAVSLPDNCTSTQLPPLPTTQYIIPIDDDDTQEVTPTQSIQHKSMV